MRRIIMTALATLVLATAGCGGPQGEEFTPADTTALRQLDADFVAAYNAKDTDKLLTLYAENSVFMPPNKPLLRGKDMLKPFYADMFAQGLTDLKMEPVDVAGHGPIAYQSGTYSLSSGATYDRGKFLFVMRKMGGKWFYQHTMWSSDLPRPGA